MKITNQIKRRIINLKLNRPYLSCRQLKDILEQEYKIKISKSSINNILKSVRLGRKKLSKLSWRYLDEDLLPLGLVLYLLVDRMAGLSYTVGTILFPQLNPKHAEFLVCLLWSSELLNVPLELLINRRAFLKLLQISLKEVEQILKFYSNCKFSTISALELKEKIMPLKYYKILLKETKNYIFIDSLFNTVYTKPTFYYPPIPLNKELLSSLIPSSPFILFTLNGFDFPSLGSLQLLEEIEKREEILLEACTSQDKTFKRIYLKTHPFTIGFFPQVLHKGTKILSSKKGGFLNFKEFDEYEIAEIKLFLPSQKKEIITSGILLYKDKEIRWGLITQQEPLEAINHFLQVYPDTISKYEKVTEAITKFYITTKEKRFSLRAPYTSLEEFIVFNIEEIFLYLTEKLLQRRWINLWTHLHFAKYAIYAELKKESLEPSLKQIIEFFNNLPYLSFGKKLIFKLK